MLIVSPVSAQHARHADDRQRQRQHDRQRVDERLELRREDQVDEDDREQQRLGQVAERLDHHLGVAADARACSPGAIVHAARPPSCASVPAVPSGRSSRFASTTTWRDRSRRLISAGEVARVKVTRSVERHQRRPRRRRHGRSSGRRPARTSPRSCCGSRTRTFDRLAFLVLVGGDRLAADEHADRVGHGAAAEARRRRPLAVDDRGGTRAGRAPSPPRRRRCRARCRARASPPPRTASASRCRRPGPPPAAASATSPDPPAPTATMPGIFSSAQPRVVDESACRLTVALALVDQLHEHRRRRARCRRRRRRSTRRCSATSLNSARALSTCFEPARASRRSTSPARS